MAIPANRPKYVQTLSLIAGGCMGLLFAEFVKDYFIAHDIKIANTK